MGKNILNVSNLLKSFSGLTAVNDVSFQVKAGEVFALIGPNGSGKTTVLNLVNGLYKPDRGSIIFEDVNITGLQPYKIASQGITRSFQHVEVFRYMTVLQNLMVGVHKLMRSNLFSSGIYWGLSQKEEIRFREKVEWVIEFLELQRYRQQMAGMLPFGIQKLVGLGRALVGDSKLLLLDEPSSGMTHQEKEDLARFMIRIKNELGIPMIWVEHDVNLVGDLADRILVLHQGAVLTEGNVDEVMNDPKVTEVFVGIA